MIKQIFDELFEQIKHGDKEHQLWLKNKMNDFLQKLSIKTNKMEKTLDNTTANQAKEQVLDIQFWGNVDTFKLISKASSKKEGWMKSTKAMQIDGVGCVVQVTTQQGQNISEAVTFVSGVKIEETLSEGKVTERKLVKF